MQDDNREIAFAIIDLYAERDSLRNQLERSNRLVEELRKQVAKLTRKNAKDKKPHEPQPEATDDPESTEDDY